MMISKIVEAIENEAEKFITKNLELSTGHICKETAEWLVSNPDNLIVYEKGEFGWWIVVDSDEIDEHLPADLNDLLILARRLNCSWIMLDRDAIQVPELPFFDW